MKPYMQDHLIHLSEFLGDQCIKDPDAKILSSELCDHFNQWAMRKWRAGRMDVRLIGAIAFGRMVKRAGIPFRVIRGKTYLTGIRVS